ncbi:hypothetical protein Cni_G14078 [Canna indica]|uniref:Reverse transcriptase domain-containing protein n=1 Tax=Canna indica TaxID=4628 RepID=A0AAQ3KBC2_9LILI|nr:hypothetical protein Cni_G14078 [Canna indica]
MYRPPCRSGHHSFWMELESILTDHIEATIVGGDFNVTRGSEERQNCRGVPEDDARFSGIIADSMFFDLPLSGRRTIEGLEKRIEDNLIAFETNRTMVADSAEIKDIRKQLDDCYQAQNVYWRQREKARWRKDGDRNTKFFHMMATARKQRNWISELKINEELIDATGTWLSDKAPGPDGLTAEFFLGCWSTIGRDFQALLEQLLFGNADWARIYKAFIALIPKMEGANEMGYFRPISLTSGVIRILSKILALCLKPLMSNLIGDSQCAFLPGKSTHNCFMAANELIHHCKRSGTEGYLSKLDLAKAFDSVSWEFLLEILRKRGFPVMWVKWISSLLHSSESSVLLNGTPWKWFRYKRGLRQGDPLSPYLFLLIADVFARLMSRANQNSMISRINPGGGREITNLEFADDFIIFTQGDDDDIENLNILLRDFFLMTGLRKNLRKTIVIHLLDDLPKAECVAEAIGCRASSFPLKYLGLPLLNGRLVRDDWLNQEGNSHALVCWEDATTPRRNGGLGIIDLDKHNLARLGRWWWGVAKRDDLLWAIIVKQTYFRRKRWQDDHSTASWFGLWKGIYDAKHIFCMGMESAVGVGNETLFWKDRWILNTRLADWFPELYTSALHKNTMIVDVWDPNNESWNLRWRNLANQSEIGRLENVIGHYNVSTSEDKSFWR